jgi:putative ABC transport system permease protein
VTGKLVAKNLKHRPMRSLLSILLIAVPVTLILTLVGMTQGMLGDARDRYRGSGADIVIRGSTAASISTFSSAGLEERYVPKVAEQPHVAAATGVYAHNLDLPIILMGINLDEFTKLSGGFQFVAGGPFEQPDDMIVDSDYARQSKLSVGSRYSVLDHKWRICGIVKPGKLIRIAVDRKQLQTLDDVQSKISVIYVKADSQANILSLRDQLREQLAPLKVYTMTEVTGQLTDNAPSLGALRIFTRVVVGIGVVIAFAVVCLAQYMAVLQRTREVGMLKSLGASKMFILGIIEVEAIGLGVGGSALGILFSYGAQWLIQRLVPASIQMAIVYEWWPIAAGIIIFASIMGALYPGLSAASHDPIEALAYE